MMISGCGLISLAVFFFLADISMQWEVGGARLKSRDNHHQSSPKVVDLGDDP